MARAVALLFFSLLARLPVKHQQGELRAAHVHAGFQAVAKAVGQVPRGVVDVDADVGQQLHAVIRDIPAEEKAGGTCLDLGLGLGLCLGLGLDLDLDLDTDSTIAYANRFIYDRLPGVGGMCDIM